MVRGYPGDQGDEKGLPGAFASKDPSLAPSSQHLLFPPPNPPLEEKRSRTSYPNHHRACKKSVWCWVGERLQEKERERVVGFSEGQTIGWLPRPL